MRVPRFFVLVLALLNLPGCGKKGAEPSESARPLPAAAVKAAREAAPPEPACTASGLAVEVVKGVRVQRFKAPSASPVGIGDGCVTLVRIDPTRYRLRLLNAASEGNKNRTVETWAKEFGLAGAINASMYGHDGRSVGLMINGRAANQSIDDHRHGGFMAFDPAGPGIAPISARGRDCAGFDLPRLRRDYHVVFQNYRLLDCDGRPIRWKDPKVFSAAAIGIGKEGDFVFIHSRTPYTMTEFASMLALPELALAQAMYVEGGPEASLYLQAGSTTIRAIGSYESAYRQSDDNRAYWEIPNVIGFSAL